MIKSVQLEALTRPPRQSLAPLRRGRPRPGWRRTAERVAGVVAELYDTTPARMRAGDRHALVLWPRQVAMFCQSQLMPEASQALAAWWGLSKTAVLHSVARVCALRDTEECTRTEICQVLAAVKIRTAVRQRHQGAVPAVHAKTTTKDQTI